MATSVQQAQSQQQALVNAPKITIALLVRKQFALKATIRLLPVLELQPSVWHALQAKSAFKADQESILLIVPKVTTAQAHFILNRRRPPVKLVSTVRSHQDYLYCVLRALIRTRQAVIHVKHALLATIVPPQVCLLQPPVTLPHTSSITVPLAVSTRENVTSVLMLMPFNHLVLHVPPASTAGPPQLTMVRWLSVTTAKVTYVARELGHPDP